MTAVDESLLEAANSAASRAAETARRLARSAANGAPGGESPRSASPDAAYFRYLLRALARLQVMHISCIAYEQ